MTRRPISAAYLERKLRSVAGLSGSNPLPGLEDLAGFVVLENDRPEWARVGGEQPGAGAGGFGAVAGNTSVVQARNPANSGVLIVVTRVSATLGAAGRLRAWAAFSAAAFGTLFVTQVNRDTRDLEVIGDSLAMELSGTNGVGAGGSGRNFMGTPVTANVPFELLGEKDEFMLAPGMALMVDTSTVNVALDVNWLWRERPLEGLWDIR